MLENKITETSPIATACARRHTFHEIFRKGTTEKLRGACSEMKTAGNIMCVQPRIRKTPL